MFGENISLWAGSLKKNVPAALSRSLGQLLENGQLFDLVEIHWQR